MVLYLEHRQSNAVLGQTKYSNIQDSSSIISCFVMSHSHCIADYINTRRLIERDRRGVLIINIIIH